MICEIEEQIVKTFASRTSIFLVFLVSMVATESRADVLFTYGYSPRGMGMGGAMTATADDFAASYYNPAGNAFQSQPNFGLGYLEIGRAHV